MFRHSPIIDLGPSRKGGAFLSLYMFRFLVVLVKISTIQHLNCKQLILCLGLLRNIHAGALHNVKKCKFSFVHQC